MNDIQKVLEARFLPFEGVPNLTIESRTTNPAVKKFFPITSDGIVAMCEYSLMQAQDHKRNVYYGVLPRVGETGNADDLFASDCLWADVDGGSEGVSGAVALIKRSGLPTPHIAIKSGSGCHAYWMLEAPWPLKTKYNRDRFKLTLRRVCLALEKAGGKPPLAHGDYASAEPARILRLPETINWKHADCPVNVKLLHFDMDAPRYSSNHWSFDLLPDFPDPRHEYGKEATKKPDSLPKEIRDIFTKPAAEGTRHDRLEKLVVMARHLGYGESELRDFGEAFCRANGLPYTEMDHLTYWAMKRI